MASNMVGSTFPSHVLVVGAPRTGKLRVVSFFSGKKLELELEFAESHSGIIVTTDLKTKYYKVELKMLVDEYPESRKGVGSGAGSEPGSGPKGMSEEAKLVHFNQWKREFLSGDFQELREALEGIVLCFDVGRDSVRYIELSVALLGEIREQLDEEGWVGFYAVVGVCDKDDGDAKRCCDVEDVEDVVVSFGFEFIDLSNSGIGEFNDRVGRDRLLEIFETHEWANMELESEAELYHSNKMMKAKQMSESLINKTGKVDENGKEFEFDETNTSSGQDLTAIMAKLSLAREKALTLDERERKEYTEQVIREVMDYI